MHLEKIILSGEIFQGYMVLLALRANSHGFSYYISTKRKIHIIFFLKNFFLLRHLYNL